MYACLAMFRDAKLRRLNEQPSSQLVDELYKNAGLLLLLSTVDSPSLRDSASLCFTNLQLWRLTTVVQ